MSTYKLTTNDINYKKTLTESFNGLCLNPNGFYLLILPVSIRWVFMKYYIKSLGMTKTQGFCQDLYGYGLF